jgi:site-specific recombinase XerD
LTFTFYFRFFLRPFWPGQLLKTHIKPVALAAGLPGIGWHTFCHTVSAWGKEAGLELEDVITLLRHEDIATTSTQTWSREEIRLLHWSNS